MSLHYYQGWAKAFAAVGARGGLRARFVNGYEYRLWEYEEVASPEEGDAKRRTLQRQLPRRWREEWLPAIQADLARWQAVDLQRLLDVELATLLQVMLARQLDHWEIHAHLGSTPLTVVQRLVDWYLERFPGAPESEPYRLVQGQVNTSLETNHLLWELSQMATPVVRQLLGRGDWSELPEAMQRGLETYWARFGRVDDALRQWTARLIVEYAESGAPDPLVEASLLAEERKQFTQEVYSRLAVDEREGFTEMLALALAHNPLTEDHNLWLDQQSNAATRRVIDEFARRLVERGILEQAGDVEYLTLYDLLQWGYGLADPVRPRVAARKSEYERYRRMRMPGYLGKPPQPEVWIDRFSGPAAPLPSEAGMVRGIGASPGTARGRARVARSLDEAALLQRGEVLVCPMTDPAWTPLFALAAALATDHGGSLCHAAVVAREYRLPAVVGTHVATEKITTGQMVEIDGTTGIIRLL
jgi:pyruvate,water dikinase